MLTGNFTGGWWFWYLPDRLLSVLSSRLLVSDECPLLAESRSSKGFAERPLSLESRRWLQLKQQLLTVVYGGIISASL